MRATYTETTYYRGTPRHVGSRTISLPFSRVAARALILRRSDRAILGVRHQKGRMMALPGGGLDDGESPDQALSRELTEEGIALIAADSDWVEKFNVDYFEGYRELNFWFLIRVDGAQLESNSEIFEWQWVAPDEDPWYPGMRDKLLGLVAQYEAG